MSNPTNNDSPEGVVHDKPGVPPTSHQLWRKKPVVVEAMLVQKPYKNVIDWSGAQPLYIANKVEAFIIRTLEGRMRADLGDYIIKGVKGEFYPCKPDIFLATYEEVTDPVEQDSDRANASLNESKHEEPNCMKPDCPFCPPIPAQQGSESTKLDEVFEDYRVLIMNGLAQGVDYADIAVAAEVEAKTKLLEWSRQERIDEHRILDELAESTANVDPDKALDDYADAKADRLAWLQSPQETSND